MINSLCGSMESLKREASFTKFEPTSPNDQTSLISESKNIIKTTPSSSDLEQSSLTPPCLDFPTLKFELDNDVEVQSPDSSMWDSLFSDQLESPDFMIMSPVRKMPSPQLASALNYNYAQAMQGHSLSGCSPPRSSSQLGAFSSSSHKGKGLSPLHKVFNSVNNHYMQQQQQEPPEVNLALPAIEEFLEDYINHFNDVMLET